VKKILPLFLMTIFLPVALFASVLQEFNINEYKNMYQITVSFDDIPQFREMTLQSPYRIVVDFKNTYTTPSKRSVTIGRPPFNALRIAQYDKETVRLVLEMTEKALHTVSAKDNTVIITVNYANEQKMDTLDRFVDVKVSPRPDSVTLTRIKIGTTIKTVNEKDGWVLILLPDGQDGWVEKSSISY